MNPNASVQTQSIQQPAGSALPTGSVLMQVSSALGAILLLILLAGWLFRRLGLAPQARGNQKLLNLRASCQVGQRERVVVVEVDNTWLVLGDGSADHPTAHPVCATRAGGNRPKITGRFPPVNAKRVKTPG